MVHDLKLTPEGGVDSYPLSPMQQGMLFHHIRGTAPGVDLEQVICELHEEIDMARFEEAWREVLARHPVLRTGFEWTGSEPRQVVHPVGAVRLDFSHADFGSERQARLGLEEYLVADRHKAFPTLAPPLVRVALLHGGPARFWLVTTYHHLVLDARAMTLLFREVFSIYEALQRGETPAPASARPYRGYIDWLASRDPADGESFWRAHLQGFAAPTPLPGSRPGPEAACAEDAPGEIAFRLPPATTARLRAVAARHDVTLNTLVQAAWALVLSRHAGDEDVVFGAVRAGRNVPVDRCDEILGMFITTVPVRVRCSAAVNIGEWLRELRRQWLAFRPYEHTPLAKIQQWSELRPGQSLFESIVSFQDPAWDAPLKALGGAWREREFDVRAQPNYPLALEALGGETLTLKLIYDRARFGDMAIARVAGHCRVTLEGLAAETCERVGELPMLTPQELQQVLVAWNRTSRSFPRERCVHHEFAAMATLQPERMAVADTRCALTYGELDLQANRLAQRLLRLGVARGSLVAVCMNRSAEMIVAWLGVLKAGAAFVPLDPAYPKERLAFQIADCGASVVLTRPGVRDTLPRLQAEVATMEMSASTEAFSEELDTDPAIAVGAGDLAYVIYTSGSTGQPKGVEIEHRALMNLVSWHRERYAVTPDDRATHLASPAFDASVWEIWPYLAAGASVHIPDDETRLSPALLWRWLAEEKITLSFMPTPLAEAALSELRPTRLALRALLTGGDKLKRRPPLDFRCPLVNHYGPTESAVVATCAVVEYGEVAGNAPSIGRPISNTRVYVLDGQMRPVPVGVPGELLIGGESLARGYLRRPELTARKFVPDPFAPAGARSRLYRTGDLVRWTERGELEFLGRLDGQIKVRGCRVELGEIEAAIQRHSSVRESLVLARPDERGEVQLVAYVVVQADIATTSEVELLEFLREKLPAYMVPAAVVLLESWPLTANGKIDRHALPAPAMRASASRDATSAPESAMERAVAKVWAEVLGRPAIGPEDNFFDLGGHSLLAAQVVARLNAAMTGAATVRALFDHPTLAAFAREVGRAAQNDSAPRGPLRLKRRPSRADMELVPRT